MTKTVILHPDESKALTQVSPNAQRLYKVARSMANSQGFIDLPREMAVSLKQLESAIKGFVELIDNGLIRDLSNPQAQTVCFGFPIYEATFRNRLPLSKGM